MNDFRNLAVWEQAHQLTLVVYAATTTFPADERFGLASQLRRACASSLGKEDVGFTYRKSPI